VRESNPTTKIIGIVKESLT